MPDIAHFLWYFCWLTFVPLSCLFYFNYYFFFNLTSVNDWSQTEREAQRRVGLTSWIFWKSLFVEVAVMELLIYWEILSSGLGSLWTLWRITCVDMELWPRLVKKKTSIQWQLLSSIPFPKSGCQHQDILRHAHQIPHQRATSPSLLSSHFFLYSLFLLPLLSLLLSLHSVSLITSSSTPSLPLSHPILLSLPSPV